MKLYSLSIHGDEHNWNFIVQLDPRYLQEYKNDGLLIKVMQEDGIEIDEVIETYVPELVKILQMHMDEEQCRN